MWQDGKPHGGCVALTRILSESGCSTAIRWCIVEKVLVGCIDHGVERKHLSLPPLAGKSLPETLIHVSCAPTAVRALGITGTQVERSFSIHDLNLM